MQGSSAGPGPGGRGLRAERACSDDTGGREATPTGKRKWELLQYGHPPSSENMFFFQEVRFTIIQK